MSSCRATTKSGKHCRNKARDNGYCNVASHQAMALRKRIEEPPVIELDLSDVSTRELICQVEQIASAEKPALISETDENNAELPDESEDDDVDTDEANPGAVGAGDDDPVLENVNLPSNVSSLTSSHDDVVEEKDLPSTVSSLASSHDHVDDEEKAKEEEDDTVDPPTGGDGEDDDQLDPIRSDRNTDPEREAYEAHLDRLYEEASDDEEEEEEEEEEEAVRVAPDLMRVRANAIQAYRAGGSSEMREMHFSDGTAVITRRTRVMIGSEADNAGNRTSFGLLPERRGISVTTRPHQEPMRRVLLNLRDPSERVGWQQFQKLMHVLQPFFHFAPQVTQHHAEQCRAYLEQCSPAQSQALLHYLTDACCREAFIAMLGDTWRRMVFERKDVLYAHTMGGEWSRREWRSMEPRLRKHLAQYVALVQQAPTLGETVSCFFLVTQQQAPVLERGKTWWTLEQGDQVTVRSTLDASTNLEATLKYAAKPLDWQGATVVVLQVPANTPAMAIQHSDANNVRLLLAPGHTLTIQSRLHYDYGQPIRARPILFATVSPSAAHTENG